MLILFVSIPVVFYTRFYILYNGIIMVPLSDYLLFLVFLIPAFLIILATMGLYDSLRKRPLMWELTRVFWGSVIDFILSQIRLFLYKEVYFSRGVLFLFIGLAFCGMCAKRVCLRLILHHFWQRGFNQKHVLLAGDRHMVMRYIQVVQRQKEYGYLADMTPYPALLIWEV